jgi:type VI secretion system protein ImpF
MARFEPELIITQSLLDRLTDDEPGAQADPPVTRAQSFRAFKAALRRDLEWLLNTRQNPTPASQALRELSRSLYNYGLPDMMSLSAQSVHDRNLLQDCLRRAVELYEPRLADVRVHAEPVAANSRMLRFRIEGLARIDPAPEHVSFDTVLELTSGEYEVK